MQLFGRQPSQHLTRQYCCHPRTYINSVSISVFQIVKLMYNSATRWLQNIIWLVSRHLTSLHLTGLITINTTIEGSKRYVAHRSFCLQFTILAEERDFENGWKWKEFKLSRARDLDLRSGHTAYRRASLSDLYLYTKFHSNWRNFLWTDGRFPPQIIRSTFGSRPNNLQLISCGWLNFWHEVVIKAVFNL